MPKNNYICQKATAASNVEKIAQYLHLTDPYIYPALCADPCDGDWVALIARCLGEEGNVFSLDHISVALCDGEIVGVACVLPCERRLTFLKSIEAPKTLADRLPPVIEGYFDPLIDETYTYAGYNISNICVDEKHRGRGVGSLLMAHCVAEYGAQTMHLDVIASNSPAISVPQIRLLHRIGI